MGYNELCGLVREHKFDRLGAADDKFFISLMPNEQKNDDLNMFIEVSEDVVKEFFIRQLCGETFSDEYRYW
jgi:hypothetical protein